MDDLIDRAEAQTEIMMSKNVYMLKGEPSISVLDAVQVLRQIPSVSTEKTGRWIMPVQDDGMSDPIYYQVRCSECGFDLDPQTWHQELHQYGADKYCPNCGAKMVEPQESEVSDETCD